MEYQSKAKLLQYALESGNSKLATEIAKELAQERVILSMESLSTVPSKSYDSPPVR